MTLTDGTRTSTVLPYWYSYSYCIVNCEYYKYCTMLVLYFVINYCELYGAVRVVVDNFLQSRQIRNTIVILRTVRERVCTIQLRNWTTSLPESASFAFRHKVLNTTLVKQQLQQHNGPPHRPFPVVHGSCFRAIQQRTPTNTTCTIE